MGRGIVSWYLHKQRSTHVTQVVIKRPCSWKEILNSPCKSSRQLVDRGVATLGGESPCKESSKRLVHGTPVTDLQF
jgi:hypothetical protein